MAAASFSSSSGSSHSSGIGAGQQLLVRVLDDEDVLDRRLVLELVEQRQQHLVDDDDLVAGVRRDVREVGRMQPEVERVEDEAAARDAEVALHVLVVVPGERRDAVAALEPEVLQPTASCRERRAQSRYV